MLQYIDGLAQDSGNCVLAMGLLKAIDIYIKHKMLF